MASLSARAASSSSVGGRLRNGSLSLSVSFTLEVYDRGIPGSFRNTGPGKSCVPWPAVLGRSFRSECVGVGASGDLAGEGAIRGVVVRGSSTTAVPHLPTVDLGHSRWVRVRPRPRRPCRDAQTAFRTRGRSRSTARHPPTVVRPDLANRTLDRHSQRRRTTETQRRIPPRRAGESRGAWRPQPGRAPSHTRRPSRLG
jgi:hypothetical protein